MQFDDSLIKRLFEMYEQSVEKPQRIVKNSEARNSREPWSSLKRQGERENPFTRAVTFSCETQPALGDLPAAE